MNYISEMEINVNMQSTENLSKLEQELKDMNEMIYKYPKETFYVQKREDIEQKFNSHNVYLRNNMNVNDFANKIINQEHNVKSSAKKFIESNLLNCLITSATQVGKTDATKDFITVCLEVNIPIIVSCDNKTDQLDQFYTRMRNEFDSENVNLVKACNPKLGKILKDCLQNNKKIVVFCLDNATQIKKVKEQFVVITTLENIKLEKIVIIHDEGDVISKDIDVEELNDDQSESHKEWLRLTQYFPKQRTDVKRVFVTASPENIVYKYKIEHIIRLTVPNNYIGYDKIKYCEMQNPNEIPEILIREQNRRIMDKENGVILYCVDRKICDGQDPTFVSVCSYIKECVVNTYNGNGITARVNDEKFQSALSNFAKLNNKVKGNKKIKFSDESTNDTKNVWNIKGMAIKDFYQICKDIGCGVFVTIGMDLIARAISFVSSEKSLDTVAATTMIYKPGNTLHAVALSQAIGRITGTARPDLVRRLYASKDVIDNYINYNENQKQYLGEIQKNQGVVTSEIMETIILNKKLSRPLDRTKLGLKPQYAQESDEEEYTEEKMKQLVNLWWNADTIIGKILRFIYGFTDGVGESELKNFIQECGSRNVDNLFRHLTNKEYKFVFKRTHQNITKLHDSALIFINTK